MALNADDFEQTKERIDMNFIDVVDRIEKLLQKEDRKDAEFRCLLVLSQIGSVGKYLTHDRELNPGARPFGSREDEVQAFGQAFVQLFALASIRGVSPTHAIQKGLENWELADWRSVEAENQEVVAGRTACQGWVRGQAWVVSEKTPLEQFVGPGILVVEFAQPEITNVAGLVLAYVTDHGGVTCHAANIARERNIPCIVGTGNATKLIKHGQQITVDARGEQGEVIIHV